MKKRIPAFLILVIIGTLPVLLDFSAFTQYFNDGLRGLKIVLISFVLPLVTPPVLYLLFSSRGLLYGSAIALVVFFFLLPFSIPIFMVSYSIYISAGLGFALFDAIQNQLNKPKSTKTTPIDPTSK